MTRKLFLLLVLAIVIPAQAHALSKGYSRGASATGITTAGTTCSCHGALTSSVDTTILGPSTILAGATQTYTAFITPLAGFLGAGIGAALGSNPLAGAALGDLEANTRILNSTTSTSRPMILPNLVHNDSALAQPDGNLADWSYDFTLTAPMTLGSIVINAAMLAFNGGVDGNPGGDTGDLWNFASRSIQVVPEPSTILLLGTGIAGLAALGRRRRP